ncbi:amidase [Pseudorhodoferax sp.]|uniref:amidase n=1 Tax=Pseudorhodoferax sp. TaxID=1993553 RepID=UPI002DD6731E|nr:amidase [Pseudorhodoferax sp.]
MTNTHRERAEAQLDRAERLNPQLHALISIQRDTALAAADAADRGERPGPLQGMTLSIKDNIDMAGLPTTAGADFLRDAVSAQDATVVARLRAAGAVFVGKANMAELAFGSRSYSAVGGQCRNPWNPARIPGGSSGGSAVSVAAGMCTASLGTDTGGSVRLPSAINGVTGLRATQGRIPSRGSLPVSAGHDTIGPIARDAAGVAAVFAVVAGHDPLDETSADAPLPDFLPQLHAGIAGRRIGIPRTHYFEQAEPAVVAAVQQAMRTLEALGARLVDVDLPMAADAHRHMSRMVFADICQLHLDRLQHQPQTITASVVERMRHGLDVTGLQYAEAVAFKRTWQQQLRELFGRVDLLLSPTTPTSAPPIEDGHNLLDATRAATRNTYAGAFGGIPGLSLPCGLSGEDLPIGLQLEAAWWQEPLLLQAGVAYQGRTHFHQLQPAMVAG